MTLPMYLKVRRKLFSLPFADCLAANQRELVEDLITKAKQVEYLINSLPVPEPEKEQVRVLPTVISRVLFTKAHCTGRSTALP